MSVRNANHSANAAACKYTDWKNITESLLVSPVYHARGAESVVPVEHYYALQAVTTMILPQGPFLLQLQQMLEGKTSPVASGTKYFTLHHRTTAHYLLPQAIHGDTINIKRANLPVYDFIRVQHQRKVDP